MAENTRAVGSVTYREAGQGYFEKRQLRRHAAFWSLWALGVGAVISGDFYGWNLGLDAGGFGGLLIAGHRHHDHVLRPLLFHRRDVTRPAAHRRRLLVLPIGDGSVGRLHHRVGREHGVRDHPRGRRRRDGLPLARHRVRPDRSRRVVEQPGGVVGDLLHHLRRDQHPRHRDHHAVHRGDHGAGARDPRVLLRGRAHQPVLRQQPAHQHPAGRRRSSFLPKGIARDLPRSTVRDLVLPRDRGAAVGRRGIT